VRLVTESLGSDVRQFRPCFKRNFHRPIAVEETALPGRRTLFHEADETAIDRSRSEFGCSSQHAANEAYNFRGSPSASCRARVSGLDLDLTNSGLTD
jgi:hypothetical protein